MGSGSLSGIAQARVLAVDDDPMITGLVRKIVQKAGHICETAESAEEALALLGETVFDLVITDVNMDKMSGLDLLEAATKDDPDLAVIMLSGINDPVTAEQALESGAFGYIVKPFEVTELQIAVSNGLRRRELETQLRRTLQGLEAEVDRRTAELRTTASELRSREQRFRSLASASPLGIVYADRDGLFEYANVAATAILGRSVEDLAGQRWITELDTPQHFQFVSALREVAAGVPDATCEYELHRSDGTVAWIRSRVGPVSGETAHATGVVVLFEDISDRKRLEGQLRHQAGHDHLTGLPNRRQFREQLAERLISLPPERFVGVLLIDLDEFKLVNDTYGHEAGDQLLMTVAERLQQCVPTGSVVARLGGDEFIVQLESSDRGSIFATAEVVREALRTVVTLVGVKLSLSASVGAAITADAQATVSALIRGADIAMHQAKVRRDSVEVFDAAMAESVARRLSVTSELRQAVDDQLITVHYQPVVDTKTQRLVGLEALARWTHHEWGRIGPDEFIPIAESSGLVHHIDRQVLEQALQQLSVWRRAGRIQPDVFMSVNMSASQLSNAALPDIVEAALNQAGIEGTALCLEVTEGTLIADLKRTVPTLERLRSLGVRIAIDDFGTGHSALSYLGKIPLDVLKVDRSFIAALGSDDFGLVQTIVDLAHRLGLRVIAEGVEEPHQLAALGALSCDMVQGFLTGRPTSRSDQPDDEPSNRPAWPSRRSTDPADTRSPQEVRQ